MKRILVLMTALVALLASLAVGEMTADEIIAKHIAATGGEKTLRGVSTLMLKGSMFMEGMPLEIKTYIKLPNKSYVEATSNNMVMGGGGTNGTDAWATQMGQTFILEGEQKNAAMKQVDRFPLLDYKTKGAKANYAGEDLVKGAKAYKVEFVTKDNDTTVYFFDATTFYIVKEKEASSTTTFSGHKPVNGVVFPFKINSTIDAGGRTMQQMVTIDSIAINGAVPESLFVMPKNAQPIPKAPGGAPGGEGN
ncbi:MAG: hypothetical protein IT585_13790 [candidate division Zixibacteria bacterium]|nr:hypothetical protein [candidate division Zixibacteria bacterium]